MLFMNTTDSGEAAVSGISAIAGRLLRSFVLLVAVVGSLQKHAASQEVGIIDLDDRRELFVDDFLTAELRNVTLQVHQPTREEIAVDCDQPWEGNGCGYFTVLHDRRESVYRMYYHAWQIPTGIEPGGPLTIACFESKDGIQWTRPDFGLCEFQGSKHNNIVLDKMADGGACHDFSPFIDENPDAKPEARYKASGAGFDVGKGIWVYQSPDGIHWTPMAPAPVFDKGAFDSQNISFWSPTEKQYVLYYRIFSDGGFRGTRLINRAVSPDYIHWKDEGTIRFPEGEGPEPQAQFYVNQIRHYERAPQIYIGFPARYVDRGLTASTSLLPEWPLREKRISVTPRYGTAVTDSVYITSRDGQSFRQSNDVFLRPGLRTRHNWSYGDNYIAWHVVETDSTRDDAPRELSLYATESYFTGRQSRLRRYSLRIDGFASIHAGSRGGSFTTKPLRFRGEELSLNAATSAAGYLQVEICKADGTAIPGFTAEDCDIIYGDSIDRRVSWKGNQSVNALSGQTVVLRFLMKEADVYSLAFVR
ncbi:MAG: hypothetical protein ACK50J_13840 [Planctomyces sp.]